MIVQLLFWFNLAYLYQELSIGIPFGPELVRFSTNNLFGPLGAGFNGLYAKKSSQEAVAQVIDKFGRYRAAFGRELSGVSLEVSGLSGEENRVGVETFVAEVVPVLRATYPSRVWNQP